LAEILVGKQSDFHNGERKIISDGEWEIGVFNVEGEFFAYENLCPHEGGPACRGVIIPKVEEIIAEDRTSRGRRFSEDQIHLACPWHGFEYDIRTGINPIQPKLRLKKFEVIIRDGEVLVVV
jgi:nitrite reductase (NADH) small subunit